MSEQRLIDIETKLAHQEALIEELNRVITTQQTAIHSLEKAVKVLAKSSDTELISAVNQKPPHY